MDEGQNSSLDSPITQKRDIDICKQCNEFRRYDWIWFYKYRCSGYDLEAKKEWQYKELLVPRKCEMKMEYKLKEWNEGE